jgi:predicted porin
MDAIYAVKKDAIAAAALSATQVLTLPSNSLAATITDNTAYALEASYTAGAAKYFLGLELIDYRNPSDPLTAGFDTIGGYQISAVTNASYAKTKELQVFWTGMKYSFTPALDVSGAWYHYDQNAYNANNCGNNSSSSCSGYEDVVSLVVDYKLIKRFDVYGGMMWSQVDNGLSNGYTHSHTMSTMVGGRFNF